MPELPEVQTTVNGINKRVKNLSIVDVWTNYKSTKHNKNQIKNPAFFKKFKRSVVEAKILKAERRGKNIIIHLSNGESILIHMKMTGHVLYGKYKKSGSKWISDSSNKALEDPFNQHIRLVFSLSNKKHLVLSDMRKFAKVTLIPSEEIRSSPEISHLGPEPLTKSFSAKIFSARLRKRPRAKIKQALLDQTLVAGIGNIYSDEILWASNIHPLTIVSNISESKMKTLWKNTKLLLYKGIDFGGDSMSDYRNIDGLRGEFQYHHKAYRQKGKPCPKKGCGGTIERTVVGGRSAHYCPTHQIFL